jgi:TonB family protein
MSGRSLLLIVCVILVLAIHLMLAPIRMPGWNRPDANAQNENKPIEISRFDNKNDKQIARTDRVEENEKNKDKKARFGAEFRNRTEKETQTPLRDRFRSGGVPKFPKVGDAKKQGALGLGMADLMPFGSSPDKLPDDVMAGNRTVLNTDGVLYASFMDRIVDKIYEPWKRGVTDAISVLGLRGKKLNDRSFVTHLVVTMNRDGEVTAIQVFGPSGLNEFDEAAKKVFFDNAPFEHPPSQMITEDGFIHLPYTFTVEFGGGLRVTPWGI